MPIKLINVNIMSQLTSRGLDNTSSAFVSDIYIYNYVTKLCYLTLKNIGRIGTKLSMDVYCILYTLNFRLVQCNATYFGIDEYQLKTPMSTKCCSTLHLWA